jgi:hypothetical protein
MSLLTNSELLTVFMTIVFKKTNAYDSVTLGNTMCLVTKWITYIEKLGQPFPSNFDFHFFLKGLKIAFEIEHSIATPRVLHLLYRTLHFMPVE